MVKKLEITTSKTPYKLRLHCSACNTLTSLKKTRSLNGEGGIDRFSVNIFNLQ